MATMDVIAAVFLDDATAEEAADDLARTLQLDEDRVTLEHVDPTAADHAGEPVLVAWVEEGQRVRARRLIGRHHGRHAPLDGVHALQEEVAPESFPAP